MILSRVVFLAGMTVANIAFACGGANEFSGVDAAREITKGQLTCHILGEDSPAKVEIFAMYRCMGSPVRAQIKTFGRTEAITSVTQTTETQFEVATSSTLGKMNCVLEKSAVSQADSRVAYEYAQHMYTAIVGLSGQRNYDLVESKADNLNGEQLLTLKYKATIQSRQVESSPYDIEIVTLNGVIKNATISAGSK